MPSLCYCGKVRKYIPCDQRDELRESFNYGQVTLNEGEEEFDSFDGCFNCGGECGRIFDCGVHACERKCHAEDATLAHCPFSPDVVSHCPCGKTGLEDLLSEQRESCSDKIPQCDKVCEKPLPCGHVCRQRCHSGRCNPCFQTVEVHCRCGRTMVNTMCDRGDVAFAAPSPQCLRICKAQLNCGRHECGEHCCAGERRAAERTQAAKRKGGRGGGASNAPGGADEIEAEHICVRVCGRTLRCGLHTCEQMCHKGACPSCLEAVFEEIACACGRTVLQPPQPCGTKAPECRFDCTRPTACGHPKVQHNCHPDSATCPRCPFLVEKPCVCRKQTLKNQPCWFDEVRCGQPCGKKLKCG